jgi:hypothetical protein
MGKERSSDKKNSYLQAAVSIKENMFFPFFVMLTGNPIP